MKLPFSEPLPAGSDRAQQAKIYRDLATEISRLQPQALTRANGEEDDHGTAQSTTVEKDGCLETVTTDPVYPVNFTKGLAHDDCGLLQEPGDYRSFVEAINSPDPSEFEKEVCSYDDRVKNGTAAVAGFCLQGKDQARQEGQVAQGQDRVARLGKPARRQGL